MSPVTQGCHDVQTPTSNPCCSLLGHQHSGLCWETPLASPPRLSMFNTHSLQLHRIYSTAHVPLRSDFKVAAREVYASLQVFPYYTGNFSSILPLISKYSSAFLNGCYATTLSVKCNHSPSFIAMTLLQRLHTEWRRMLRHLLPIFLLSSISETKELDPKATAHEKRMRRALLLETSLPPCITQQSLCGGGQHGFYTTLSYYSCLLNTWEAVFEAVLHPIPYWTRTLISHKTWVESDVPEKTRYIEYENSTPKQR